MHPLHSTLCWGTGLGLVSFRQETNLSYAGHDIWTWGCGYTPYYTPAHMEVK